MRYTPTRANGTARAATFTCSAGSLVSAPARRARATPPTAARAFCAVARAHCRATALAAVAVAAHRLAPPPHGCTHAARPSACLHACAAALALTEPPPRAALLLWGCLQPRARTRAVPRPTPPRRRCGWGA
eukprot:3038685-Prymnesium_polylepis.1